VGVDETERTGRIIANVFGEQRSGKDHFAFTAPGPLVLFNFDVGVEGVIERFVQGDGVPKRRIIVAGDPSNTRKGSRYPSYHVARPVPGIGQKRTDSGYLDSVKKAASPVWERFISDLAEFYKSEARTGIIDTGGAAYALAKFAFHGMDKGKPPPKDDPYGQKTGELKAIFQGLIADGYNYNKNVLWLHRISEVWVGGAPSGQFKSAGYPDVAYECMVSLRMRRTVKNKVPVFSATVADCRHDQSLNGEVFEGKQCTFATVMSIITGTDEEVWR
jgi:hypothetical protein